MTFACFLLSGPTRVVERNVMRRDVQDLREAYLEGKYGNARDAFAAKFDEQLLHFVALSA